MVCSRKGKRLILSLRRLLPACLKIRTEWLQGAINHTENSTAFWSFINQLLGDVVGIYIYLILRINSR